MSKSKIKLLRRINPKAVRFFAAALLCFALFTSCSAPSSGNILPSQGAERSDAIILTESDYSLPQISAKSAILIESGSGTVIGAKNADEKMPMASTTKIMTALVAIERGDINKTVSVSPAAVGVEGSSVYLYEGERLSLHDLIYAMMLESANDAATAIAIEVGGSVEGFADLMNDKARDLGLTKTHFTNPHGLDDPEHYTTARELGIIALAAMKNETFKSVVSTYKKTIPLNETEGVRLLINHNKMLKGYSGAIGIKTGYTKKSGRCLVSAAERDGVSLISVTLNAPDDWQDHSKMLDLGFSLFESKLLCLDGEFTYTLPIVGGDKDYITVKNKGELKLTLPRDMSKIAYRVELANFEYAPIDPGEEVGRLIFYADGIEIASVPLVASFGSERTVYKKSFLQRLFGG